MGKDFDITLNNPREIINTLEFRFDNYDIIKNIDGDYMIIGTSNCTDESRVGGTGSAKTHNNASIFYDMIFLATKLNIKRGTRSFIQSQFDESHFFLITEFCKKHGLPYHGNIQTDAICNNNFDNNDYFSKSEIDKLKNKYSCSLMCYGYCNLSYFVYWLYVMYRDFLWYISIYSQDTVYSFSEFLGVDMSYYLKKKERVGKHFSPSIANHFLFNSVLRRKENTFTFEVKTNNIFHLSVYYFCLICIGNNSINLSKTMLVKQCKCCGSYFLTSQSRKRHCEYCSPQKAWNRRNR